MVGALPVGVRVAVHGVGRAVHVRVAGFGDRVALGEVARLGGRIRGRVGRVGRRVGGRVSRTGAAARHSSVGPHRVRPVAGAGRRIGVPARVPAAPGDLEAAAHAVVDGVGLRDVRGHDVGEGGRARRLDLEGVGAGAVDLDVVEVQPVRRALDEVDRGVGAVQHLGVGDVDGGVDRFVESAEPDRADAEAPVVVVVAGTDERVARCRDRAGNGCALAGVDSGIAVGDVQPAAVGDGVRHDVVGDGDVLAAVRDDVVGQDRQDHGVERELVLHVRDVLRPHRQTVVTGVADEGVGDRGVGDAVVEVHAVGGLVQDAAVLDGEVVHRTVHPGTALGVLHPDVVDGRVRQGAADGVDLVVVLALPDVADDREVLERDVAAAALRGVLPVDADGLAPVRRVTAGQHRVPGACSAQRHLVHDDVVADLEGALRDVHLLALRLARVDGRLDLGGRVGGPGRVGTEVGDDVEGARGLGGRRGHLLEVRQVDGERR